MRNVMDNDINHGGSRRFLRMSKLDYALLPIMLLTSIPAVYWAIPRLFLLTPSDWVLAIVTVLIAVVTAAYVWQSAAMSRLPGVLAMTVACVAVYFLGWPNHPSDHLMSALVPLVVGTWSVVRYVILLGLGDKAPAT